MSESRDRPVEGSVPVPGGWKTHSIAQSRRKVAAEKRHAWVSMQPAATPETSRRGFTLDASLGVYTLPVPSA